MTFPPSGTKKLALDPESFQQLLAAAYTLQENKSALKSGDSEQDLAAIFSEVAVLRSRILAHVRAVTPDVANPQTKAKATTEAAAQVADCLRRVTRADGASVCLIVDGYLRPTACSGKAVKVSGGSVASNSLVATERLRNGRAFQSANACSDIRLGPSVCVDLQIGSLLAFPLDKHNEIAGLIEVRWTKPDAFSDLDERICQLMADLMAEVLEGGDDRVNPQGSHPVKVTASGGRAAESAMPVTKSETQGQGLPSNRGNADAKEVASDHICRVCGEPLSGDGNFCGSCGMLSASSDNSLQGKWASMWFMQQAQKAVETRESERLWPLHPENPQNADAGGGVSTAESLSSANETDEDDETSSERKRSPRGVLAVLKSRFRARAVGQ